MKNIILQGKFLKVLLADLLRSLSGVTFLEKVKAIEALDHFTGFEDPEFLNVFPFVKKAIDSKGSAQRKSIEQEIVDELSVGVYHLLPMDPLYPRGLRFIDEPPLCLRFLGSPIWMAGPGLAVVGSREPSWESQQWLEEHLGSFLKRNSLHTVSGGARGVDQKVHSVSLRNHCPTLVLLPSGFQNIYPVHLLEWKEAILRGGGAFLTEYSYGTPMRKHHFIERNRLISALGLCTFIVEARPQSGSLITAQRSIEQNKPVLVLPSHPLDMKARGGLALLAEGATMIRDAHDLETFWLAEMLSCGARGWEV